MKRNWTPKDRSFLIEASAFAERCHEGQTRKGTAVPYFTHPAAVAGMIEEIGGSKEQIAAAYLHDVVEDCGVPLATIRSDFGEKVAAIVQDCTKDKPLPGEDWRSQRERFVQRARFLSETSLLVFIADKAHNARCIVEDLKDAGDSLWKRFTGSREDVIWYYARLREEILKAIEGHSPTSPVRLLGEVFAEVSWPIVSLQGDDGGGIEAALDDLDWDLVKESLDPAYVAVVERVQFETLAKEKAAIGDWSGFLNAAERFHASQKESAAFWHWVGRAHREMDRYPEAGTAFLKSLAINPNDFTVIQLLASSCYLTHATGVLTKWLNENFTKLDASTAAATAEYLNRHWLQRLTYDPEKLDSEVWSAIYRHRSGREDHFKGELRNLGLHRKRTLLPLLKGCLAATRPDLVPSVLEYGPRVTDRDRDAVLDLLVGLLEAGELRFESIPEKWHIELVAYGTRKHVSS